MATLVKYRSIGLPVYCVFDGDCVGKSVTKRKQVRRAAAKKVGDAWAADDAPNPKDVNAAFYVRSDIVVCIVNRLRRLGFPYLVAEEEADAQLGAMYELGMID